MSTMEITKNAPRGFVFFGDTRQDDTLSAAGAVTYLAGTILGRITTGGKLTHYDSAASDGSENPVAVLAEEQVFTALGDRAIRPIISGSFDRSGLVIHGGVTPVSPALADSLRSMGLLTEPNIAQLASYDNE
jgi:hypothetical protein